MKAAYAWPLAAVLTSAAGLAFAANSTADSAAKPAANAAMKPTAATAAAAATVASAAARPATRDWSQVDTNRDGLVSPEEMEAYLNANPGPLKGK